MGFAALYPSNEICEIDLTQNSGSAKGAAAAF